MEEFKIKKLVQHALTPYKAHSSDAGFDLFACLATSVGSSSFIAPGDRVLISTGLEIAVPEGYYGRVAPRSGLATKGIDIGAGVVDSSYRGELKILVINNGKTTFEVKHGLKIAQLILEKISTIDKVTVVASLDETERGEGGFGSTDK